MRNFSDSCRRLSRSCRLLLPVPVALSLAACGTTSTASSGAPQLMFVHSAEDLKVDRAAGMVVRFFGAWDFETKDAQNRMPAQIGYTKGVPMGGDPSGAPQGKAPTFLVAALKIPSARTSTVTRSSRAGWTRIESCTKGLRRRVVGRA